MKELLLLVCIVTFTFQATAQVGVNDDNSVPNTSAMLDVKSTLKGFLAPRNDFYPKKCHCKHCGRPCGYLYRL